MIYHLFLCIYIYKYVRENTLWRIKYGINILSNQLFVYTLIPPTSTRISMMEQLV